MWIYVLYTSDAIYLFLYAKATRFSLILSARNTEWFLNCL